MPTGLLVRELIVTGVSFVSALSLGACSRQPREPVDYVNPNIGGIGYMRVPTQPAVQLPHGMMRIAPNTTPGVMDRYLADKIYSFPAGAVTLMPITGPAETEPAKFASTYDHGLETATPYYYSATLERYDTVVEYTVTEHAAYYQLLFPGTAPPHVLLMVDGNGEIRLPKPTSMEGRGGGAYFFAEFSHPVTASKVVTGIPMSGGRQQTAGTGQGVLADFSPGKGARVGLRVGFSYISIDQARQSLLGEIPQWNFDQTKSQARARWNQELSKITVTGGTEDERTIFYTALYRVLCRGVDITEGGQYFSGYDNKVHSSNGRRFYVGDAFWDTYRSLHPAQLLIEPERQVDMIRSLVLMYEQSGWLPSSSSLRGGQRGMIGHHSTAMITDTYMKGFRDFDVEKAYAGMKKNAMESTMLRARSGPATPLDKMYMEKGFFPALGKHEKETVKEVHPFEKRQSVSITLEHAYDDWCLAQMAKALNKQDDYAYFMKRAHYYENVFDSRIGFMAPRTADGNWKYDDKEFNPVWAGGQGGRDYYTEMNAWIYTFHVQHDVAGLIRLLGGREPFLAKLDRLYQEQYGGYNGDPDRGGTGGTKYFFLSWFPDQAGLIGNYSMGNEPSFHIPYLYNYAGQPWKTQRKVREAMAIYYNAGPTGIYGDEDGGGMSSWYVMSAMGIFTVCPGRPVYDIGSPIFRETKIQLGGGKVFTITANNVSAVNKYIQSAQLNGKPLNKPWFEHAEIANGGSMILEMGPRPNTAWGSAPESAPPSMSQ